MSVNLEKGQRISLTKGNSLARVFMGLGWDMAASGQGGFFKKMFGGNSNIDLDASCLLFDSNKTLLDIVYFGNLLSSDGSIRHMGDNLTGEGEGDDEVIQVNLAQVPNAVAYLVFTVSSYRGQTFNQIANAFCRLVDMSTNTELARYTITGGGNYTGLIMACLYRHGGEWKMRAIGEFGQSKIAQDLAVLAKNCI